jgi:GTP-binding protein LepA
MNNIRNFCIIAHIDHGKSTLSDRLLELTGTVAKREMKAQLLDSMDLERERGITIKLTPVRMDYTLNANRYTLNLIDTPGHVDFTYEVSRSLAACEGAVLLVDATQGVQAQTIANLYMAIEQGLVIIPVINKIDLPNADIPRTKNEIIKILGCREEEILSVSGKTGEGALRLIEEVIAKVPAPKIDSSASLRALIFDSQYDDYRGVVAFIRVFDGKITSGMQIECLGTGIRAEVLEVGFFKPKFFKSQEIASGETGYIVTGIKDIGRIKVGDTVAEKASKVNPLPGYKDIKPMVFAGIFPKDGSEFEALREAMGKLKLNDAALFFEPERSEALGFGFRVGFLGLLHLEIIVERLRRESNIEVIVTAPSVAYEVTTLKGEISSVRSPQELPHPSLMAMVKEPWIKADIITPRRYIGDIMGLVAQKRGLYKNTDYLDEDEETGRAILHYEMPLYGVITDFYDKLKSVTSGYASLNYELSDYREADIIRVDILVAQDVIEALSLIVYRDEAYSEARRMVDKLKDILPRRMFEVKIQAVLNYEPGKKGGVGKIIASSRIPAMRKDVTAHMYGGDITRRKKLWEKQRRGKLKMKEIGIGKVDIPQEAFTAIFKRE